MVENLGFYPIRYAKLHSQLNPYNLPERKQLEQQRKIDKLTANMHKLAELEELKPQQQHIIEYLRIAVVSQWGKCSHCGRDLNRQNLAVKGFMEPNTRMSTTKICCKSCSRKLFKGFSTKA
jgi:hypothetical protein